MNEQTRFERHGRVHVAPSGTHLAHEDGTPFFYLADTAWNGVILSQKNDWDLYLADRAAKGFTAIQFIIMAPWSAALHDAERRTAFDPADPSKINAAYFDRIDERINSINDAGLLAVPVMAWAANFGASAKLNPGHALGSTALLRVLEYQFDRYEKTHLMWILAGDGKYDGWWRSRKWRRMGRSLLHRDAPIAMHPMGKTWPYQSFRNQPWLNVLGYQSGHSDDPKTMRWLLEGPPARAWRNVNKPIINLEPCYEGIRNWANGGVFTAPDVRRAIYPSLLNAPTAGVTYGAHGVWSWESAPQEPLNHKGCGIAQPWHQAIHFPGSLDIQRMADLFTSFDWHRLRPAPDLKPSPTPWNVSCSATDTRDLIVCYLPSGGAVSLSISGEGEWFNPRSGERQPARTGNSFFAPDTNDWILLLHRRP